MNVKKIIGLSLFFPVSICFGLYISGCVYFLLAGAGIHQVTPFSILEQSWYYLEDPLYRKDLFFFLLLAVTVGCFPFLIILTGFASKEALHGSAAFASTREIRKKKLFKNIDDGKGILIGRVGRKILYYGGNAFVFLAAPSRSGKGIGVIIPNLLRWCHSAVVTDFKLENFSITSRFRQSVLKQDVFLFNPFSEDGKTHRYNPLGYVREGDLCIPDLLTITEIIYPTSSGDNTSKYFAGLAQNLFLGLALYVKETPELPFTIGEIVRQSKKDINTLAKKKGLSEACLASLGDFLSQDKDKGQKDVLSSFKSPLLDWSNPNFDAATSANDFDLRDIRKKRMTIYVGTTPDYIPNAGRILNLFFSHLINLNTKELPEQNATLKYKCMLLMDEFTAMGYSAIIAKSNNYFAGYGLQLVTIVQNPAQISANQPEGYGKDTAKTFLSNHEAQVFFTPEKEDADDIEKFLGNKTVKATSIQTSSGKSGKTFTSSLVKRPLMLAQELRLMPFEKQIILMRGNKPIFCNKIHYYQESPFIDYLKSVSPSLSRIKGIPKKKQLDGAIANKELQIDIPVYTRITEKKSVVFASPLDNMPEPTNITAPTAMLDIEYSSEDIDMFE